MKIENLKKAADLKNSLNIVRIKIKTMREWIVNLRKDNSIDIALCKSKPLRGCGYSDHTPVSHKSALVACNQNIDDLLTLEASLIEEIEAL